MSSTKQHRPEDTPFRELARLVGEVRETLDDLGSYASDAAERQRIAGYLLAALPQEDEAWDAFRAAVHRLAASGRGYDRARLVLLETEQQLRTALYAAAGTSAARADSAASQWSEMARAMQARNPRLSLLAACEKVQQQWRDERKKGRAVKTIYDAVRAHRGGEK